MVVVVSAAVPLCPAAAVGSAAGTDTVAAALLLVLGTLAVEETGMGPVLLAEAVLLPVLMSVGSTPAEGTVVLRVPNTLLSSWLVPGDKLLLLNKGVGPLLAYFASSALSSAGVMVLPEV
jgi:hypothetical protein